MKYPSLQEVLRLHMHSRLWLSDTLKNLGAPPVLLGGRAGILFVVAPQTMVDTWIRRGRDCGIFVLFALLAG